MIENKDVTLLHVLSENVTHFNYKKRKEGGDTRIHEGGIIK